MSDDRPILDQINLVSGDVEASVAFYRLLGVEIADTAPGWNRHHRNADFGADSQIDLDVDSSEFAAHWGGRAVPPGPLLGFRVTTREAVDTLYQRLTAGGHRGLRAPYDAFWGVRFAIVEDPGGTAVGLMSEPSAAHRGATPDLAEFEAGASD
ncbi:MAG: VOC family protein [Chloroflexi bacterium]|nr:VOC family protein [Chloroflexota bacterium]MDA1146526.1 VOC family protein [Chloroflexota bacterium]